MNCQGNIRKAGRSGMSLLELMIAVVVATLVILVVVQLTMYTARTFVALGNYDALDRASVLALDTMSRDIRQAQGVTAFATNQLTLLDYDGTPLIFVWNPAPNARTVTRIKGAQAKVLLQQCDYLSFSLFQRNPTNDFTFVPTTSLSEAKLVAVNWRCSRQILQQKVNTESVQTANIVIRN